MAYGDTTENALRRPLVSRGTPGSLGLNKPPAIKKPKRLGILDQIRMAGEKKSRLGEMAAARGANQGHLGVRQPFPTDTRRLNNGNGR